MNTIETTLIEYIRLNILKRSKVDIDPNEPLISTGLIDSFHLVDIAVFVEEQFGVRIDDTELNADTFDSVAQLANMINLRRNL